MAFRPLKSPFYEDVQIGQVKLANLDQPVWQEKRADSLLRVSEAGSEVAKLAGQLSDRQSKTLLTTLRRATELAVQRDRTLLVDFWERRYNVQTSPADSDQFVYVREDLPRVSSPADSEFRVAVQFS